ncbi:MAG: hypothetical protein ACRDRA_17690 [Pseudonocardiaceae bacterium]
MLRAGAEKAAEAVRSAGRPEMQYSQVRAVVTLLLSVFAIWDKPDLDPDGRLDDEKNLKKARLRVRVGLVFFAPLTVLLAALSATTNGLWWVAFSSGGPLLLLVLTRKISLARLPIVVVLLAFIPSPLLS